MENERSPDVPSPVWPSLLGIPPKAPGTSECAILDGAAQVGPKMTAALVDI